MHINKEFNALKSKYEHLSDDFMNQAVEIKKLVEENKDLHNLLDEATNSFKSVTMAINCLVYDDNYKLDLDKKRKNLLKAIDKYTMDKLKIYGFVKKAEELLGMILSFGIIFNLSLFLPFFTYIYYHKKYK